MEFLNEYMVAIVVGICLVIGFVIKHVINSEKVNRLIPLMMGVLGVVLNAWVNDWAFTPEILLGGLISGLASTGMHQAFKQLFFKETE